MIHTVLGQISPESMGHAQLHEHIWLNKGASYECSHALVADHEALSLKELEEYRGAGGTLLVDAQPTGCGRSAKHLASLSKKSGVSIVGTAGFHKQMFFDHRELLEKKAEELAEIYIAEINTGMFENEEQTIYPAGILKVSMENNWNSDSNYQKLFDAVAQAAARTNAPVMVHTEKENDVLGLIEWFAGKGIPAEKLMICHLDRTHYDAVYHKEVLSTGCYFDYDSVHRLKYLSDEEEMKLLLAMKEAGYVNKIVLALDTTNQRLRAYGAPDMGLDYILKNHIPMMKDAGFTDAEINLMCVENARKILDF